MSKKLRYRLQKKVPIARQNILGNHSFPVHTYQWWDIAASDDREALVKVMPNDRDYRIEDTAPYTEENSIRLLKSDSCGTGAKRWNHATDA